MKALKNIYIIDDDHMYTYLLSRQIGLTGYKEAISIFKHGMEALSHLSAIKSSTELLPDLILLDLNMPVMDGWQFLDAYSRLNLVKDISIYILSSSIDTADHQRAAQYKVVKSFLTKPITKTNLQEIFCRFPAS